LNDLIYSFDGFDNARSLALLVALFAIAWLYRDRRLKFCWLFVTIGVLPIAFIPPRGLYAVYIPMVGLAMFFAILLVKVTRRIDNQLVRAVLFAIAAVGLSAIHAKFGAANIAWITAEEHHVRDVVGLLRQAQPEAPKGSRILLLKDPFEGRIWDSTFLIRLFYRDNSIVVDRGADHDLNQYNYVWTFEDGKLLKTNGPN